MIFPYSMAVVVDDETGGGLLRLRPEIPIRVWGPKGARSYVALVDTGADNAILPRSAAEALGIELHPIRHSASKAFGGQSLALLAGDAEIEISHDQESYRWMLTCQFFDFESTEDEVVILGHSGFLDYFTAIFDGDGGQLELRPNRHLPFRHHEAIG